MRGWPFPVSLEPSNRHAQTQTLWNPLISHFCKAGAAAMLRCYRFNMTAPDRVVPHGPNLPTHLLYPTHFVANRDASRHSGFPSTRSAATHSILDVFYCPDPFSHARQCLPKVETVKALSHPCFLLPHWSGYIYTFKLVACTAVAGWPCKDPRRVAELPQGIVPMLSRQLGAEQSSS